jgi:hypothetical protein
MPEELPVDRRRPVVFVAKARGNAVDGARRMGRSGEAVGGRMRYTGDDRQSRRVVIDDGEDDANDDDTNGDEQIG